MPLFVYQKFSVCSFALIIWELSFKLEIMEKSGEEGMPDLAHVMRILSAENIPNLPPGGGLAGK